MFTRIVDPTGVWKTTLGPAEVEVKMSKARRLNMFSVELVPRQIEVGGRVYISAVRGQTLPEQGQPVDVALRCSEIDEIRVLCRGSVATFPFSAVVAAP